MKKSLQEIVRRTCGRGTGNDTLISGKGGDILIGGAGDDTLDAANDADYAQPTEWKIAA